MEDPIRDVEIDGYRLTLWTTNRTDWRGQTILRYRLQHPDGRTLFEGDDFAGSPLHADDSDETVRSILSFLTLRPGDTDREYFDSYTPEQRDWAESEAESLSYWAYSEDGAVAFAEWGGAR